MLQADALHVVLLLAQIAKRRSKVPSTKSPGVHLAKPAQRPMKHLSLLPFSCIKRILDITETAGGSSWFHYGE